MLAIFFCLVHLLLREGGPSSSMSVLRIYKIRYDRVSREIIYPRRPLTLLSLNRTRGARFRGFAQRLKARLAKKRIDQPNINRRIFYSTRNLSARRTAWNFGGPTIDWSPPSERRLISSGCRHLPPFYGALEAWLYAFAREAQSSRSIPFLSKDKRETGACRKARETSEDGDKRAKHYISKSLWPSRKIVSGPNLEGKSFPWANQNRGSNPGPVFPNHLPLLPAGRCCNSPARLSAWRTFIRSYQGRYFSRDLATSLNPLHKHCIVFHARDAPIISYFVINIFWRMDPEAGTGHFCASTNVKRGREWDGENGDVEETESERYRFLDRFHDTHQIFSLFASSSENIIELTRINGSIILFVHNL